jgi:hypothetical protein
LGSPDPRIRHVPAAVGSRLDEALGVAELAGVDLDAAQRLVLDAGLRLAADGEWAADRVAVVCPRQNGKSEAAVIRTLAGALVYGERLIIYSAHEAATSLEIFARTLALLESSRELSARVRRVSRAHGAEAIELAGPLRADGRRATCRVLFRSRTKVGARGFAGADTIIFDEGQILPEAMIAALLPIVVTRPGSQIWFLATAPDPRIHADALTLARLRECALKGDDPRLAFVEWSAEGALEDAQRLVHDDDALRQANPALGRIPRRNTQRERATMDPMTYAIERLGVTDWPTSDTARELSVETWAALAGDVSELPERVALAVDAAPSLRSATIAAAGVRADGKRCVWVADHRPGAAWVVDRLAELTAAHRHVGVAVDLAGPARAVGLSPTRFRLRERTAGDVAAACQGFVELARCDELRHGGDSALDDAVRGAVARPAGDGGWCWSRRDSRADISPLVAGALAVALCEETIAKPSVYETRRMLIV